jgi:hypothetical protein
MILLVNPPRERPIAWFWVPPCAGALLVDPDDGAVGDHVFQVRITAQHSEYPVEHTPQRPPAEPLEDRIPIPEVQRQIPPWRANPRDPQHRFQKQAVVLTGSPRIAGLAWDKSGDLVPLRVAERESIHGWAPCPALNRSSVALGSGDR